MFHPNCINFRAVGNCFFLVLGYLEMKNRKFTLAEGIYYLVEIGLSLLLFRWPLLLAALLLFAFFIGGRFFWSTFEVILYITGLVIGTLGERLCVFLGIWQYAYSSFWELPLWLPFAWGNASVFIYVISCAVFKRKNK